MKIISIYMRILSIFEDPFNLYEDPFNIWKYFQYMKILSIYMRILSIYMRILSMYESTFTFQYMRILSIFEDPFQNDLPLMAWLFCRYDVVGSGILRQRHWYNSRNARQLSFSRIHFRSIPSPIYWQCSLQDTVQLDPWTWGLIYPTWFNLSSRKCFFVCLL